MVMGLVNSLVWLPLVAFIGFWEEDVPSIWEGNPSSGGKLEETEPSTVLLTLIAGSPRFSCKNIGRTTDSFCNFPMWY